jgi:hypothetical protein
MNTKLNWNKKKTKYSKEIEYWLNESNTSNLYTPLLEEEREDQQHKLFLKTRLNALKFIKLALKNISPLIESLEQIAKEQYEINALADNQVKFQSKTWNAMVQL